MKELNSALILKVSPEASGDATASSMISRTASSAASRNWVKAPSSGRSDGMSVASSQLPLMCRNRSSCTRGAVVKIAWVVPAEAMGGPNRRE